MARRVVADRSPGRMRLGAESPLSEGLAVAALLGALVVAPPAAVEEKVDRVGARWVRRRDSH